jgi:DNA-binding LytR/AlgR family response regulator
MKIVIIEDEAFALRRLENMIREYSPDFEIVARLESVTESVEWFLQHDEPELIFLDIHLEDDLSFSIFNKISVTCPIVFTTATDELAVKAFQLKGIDFLHKPIVQSELNHMLEKYSNPGNYTTKVINSGYFDEILNRK